MQKIRLRVKLKPDFPKERIYDGSLSNGIISYIEDKELKVEVDLKNLIITREDKEKRIVIDYQNKIIHIILKEYNYDVDMPIEMIKKEIKNNHFSISYKLEQEVIEYTLDYEVI